MQSKYKVKLIPAQRNILLTLVGNGKEKAKKLTHARILLQADCSKAGQALNSKAIAKNLHIHERLCVVHENAFLPMD
jgi:hypothetical protein